MPKTLLLADDSVTIQKVVGISFANEDVALLTVDNGDDAVAQAREARPDIILADVVMPGMNGYEVCEAIKSDPQLRDTPVLLLTGTFEAFDEERAARAGADGHITKPFEAQALVDQVNARLAQAAVAPPAAEPEATSAPPAAAQEIPAPEPAPELPSASEASSEGGASFDFFDEEITEPRSTPESETDAETIVVSDDLEVDGEDAFDFEASSDFEDELSASSPNGPTAEIDAPAEMPASPEAPEMEMDATRAILPDDEAFAGSLAEPSESPPTLGESDLDQLEPEQPVAAAPLEDFTSSLPEEPAPTRVIHEAPTLEDDLAAISEAATAAPDETLILSDLDSDPFGGSGAGDAVDDAETAPPDASDPLAEAEPDGLAVEAVLDPAGGRDYDVSSSDLGDPLQELEAAPLAAEEPPSSPWMAGPSALDEAEVLSEPASEEPPDLALEEAPAEPAPDLQLTPTEEAASPASAVDLSPLAREQLHDALEKIAWEAFGDVTEQIVNEALERIERVAWEVIPQMAEALIREEIRKLKGEDD